MLVAESPSGHAVDSAAICRVLCEVRDLLSRQHAPITMLEPFSCAARIVAERSHLADTLSRGGIDALQRELGLATPEALIACEIVRTGGWTVRDWLTGLDRSGREIATIPAVGAAMFEFIHDRLGATTYERLWSSLQAGRLSEFERCGPKRSARIDGFLRDTLGIWEAETIIERPPDRFLRSLACAYRLRIRDGPTLTRPPFSWHTIVNGWHCSVRSLPEPRHISALIHHGDLQFLQFLLGAQEE